MKKISYLLSICLMACMAACEKELPPSLSNIVVDTVTESTITCHYDVTEGAIVETAFFYGTSKNSVQNMKGDKVQGISSGTTIQGEIAGLKANTNYYIIGYAMNEKGRATTEVISVKTLSRTPQAEDNLHPGTTE